MHNLDALVKDHPHIAVLNQQEALALADVGVAQTEKKADWTMELMFNQRGPAYSNMVSINFSVPLQRNQENRIAVRVEIHNPRGKIVGGSYQVLW